jgi:hypothetical protein
MLREIGHFIAGEAYAPSGRTGDVFDPTAEKCRPR